MPGTFVHYRPHPFDIGADRYADGKAKEILGTAGGITINAAAPELKKFLSIDVTAKRMFHGSGGCRFGDGPNISILDRDCQVHGCSNLLVTDGSFVPTGSGVNSILTVQANTLRVGKRISEPKRKPKSRFFGRNSAKEIPRPYQSPLGRGTPS